MYKAIKFCIRTYGEHSELFLYTLGVRQGENLSLLLFCLYLNDLKSSFYTKT